MVYVWFLMATISGADGAYGFNNVGVFNSLSECESAAYNAQDYTIGYEKANTAEVELHCIKHGITTI